mmetsp:Transcript_11289/g.28547  ORF Transcript_11289/g.28547 Transcript_11289/m.28547 type:complete len:252 (+) Transcript_11289:130-885(+)
MVTTLQGSPATAVTVTGAGMPSAFVAWLDSIWTLAALRTQPAPEQLTRSSGSGRLLKPDSPRALHLSGSLAYPRDLWAMSCGHLLVCHRHEQVLIGKQLLLQCRRIAGSHQPVRFVRFGRRHAAWHAVPSLELTHELRVHDTRCSTSRAERPGANCAVRARRRIREGLRVRCRHDGCRAPLRICDEHRVDNEWALASPNERVAVLGGRAARIAGHAAARWRRAGDGSARGNARRRARRHVGARERHRAVVG